MFELSIARKYLVPKKKQLSVSLIALMSVGVISLVVWLVLVFLSVTQGMEKSWLEKLTSLHAPLKITPTPAYYSSYYYQIDSVSQASDYTYKTIGEKAASSLSDPYSLEEDAEIPLHFPQADRDPNAALKDPVKQALAILSHLKSQIPDLAFQDYEIGGALMRLQLFRPKIPLITTHGDEIQSFLTQVSYLASFPDQSPYLHPLLLPPQIKDLNQLFYLANRHVVYGVADAPSDVREQSPDSFREQVIPLLENIKIKELKTSLNTWRLPSSLLPQDVPIQAVGYFKNGQITHLLLPTHPTQNAGILKKEEGFLVFQTLEGTLYPLSSTIPLFVDHELRLQATFMPQSLQAAGELKDLRFQVTGHLQKAVLKGELAWEGLEISQADIQTEYETSPLVPPPWVYHIKNSGYSLQTMGILLPKNLSDSGARLGDSGYLSYSAVTPSSMQEQRLPFYVAGFYDPGIMAVGNKCLLVPMELVRRINASSSFDKSFSNGIQIWIKDLTQTKEVKKIIEAAFLQAGISSYWTVSTFHDYDFAKDLLQQFQSDKYLFTLIAGIILIVACCNIISLLVLLVNDKKREIGILQAMGASSQSIALIFGLCGVTMGILSSLIGTAAALFTLHHIDSVVQLLSFLQGHDAFNAVFYGNSLPNRLSGDALIFVLIATPLISACAGLVPAIKACRLQPSQILRS